tara:strand:- start:447 stop:884 length:438 start_codon:yes stop_codon:yes gene_type:complete
MLTPEEYTQFEQRQSQKYTPATPHPSMRNHLNWQATRYDNNLKRYFITATEELGAQFKQYADRAHWQGGTLKENYLFEQLQYYYRQSQDIRVSRTRVNTNCSLFEITQRGQPLTAVMMLDNDQKYISEPHKLKDGYRYRFVRISR